MRGDDARPNFLLVLTDSWRADYDGFARHTNSSIVHRPPHLRLPEFHRLAARGALFQHAFTSAPLCTPARITLLTGRDYDAASAPGQSQSSVLPTSFSTLYSELSRLGYYTMQSGYIPSGKAPQALGRHPWTLNATAHTAHKEHIWQMPLGWELGDTYHTWLQQNRSVCGTDGFAAFKRDWAARLTYRSCGSCAAPPAVIPGPTARAGGGTRSVNVDALGRGCQFPDALGHDDFAARRALELLGDAPESVPWMLTVDLVAPHPPFLRTHRPRTGQPCTYARGEREFERCRYAADIEHVDELLGQILGAPRVAAGAPLTMVTSDHGEMLWDRGLWGKGVPFRSAVAIPLVVAGADVPEGVRLHAPVSLIDVTATFLDYAGASPARLQAIGMTATSFRPLLTPERSRHHNHTRRAVRIGLFAWRALVGPVESAPLAPLIKLIRAPCRGGSCVSCVSGLAPGSKCAKVPGAACLCEAAFDLSADPDERRPLSPHHTALAAHALHAAGLLPSSHRSRNESRLGLPLSSVSGGR